VGSASRTAGLILGIVALLTAASTLAQGPTRWVDGELLIGFRAGVGPLGRNALYRSIGGTHMEDIGQTTGMVRLRVPAATLELLKTQLERLPQVKFVEKNYHFDPALVPNDAAYPNQWHLPRINAPQAWEITQGSAGAVIAILDSGIEATHPDLAGKLVPGYNTYANSNDTSDAYGHGTMVAGVAGALTNNGQGISAVAGASPLMPVRVTDTAGRASSASIANGIIWASDHGARVVNISFNGVAANTTIRTAAEYAYNRGTLVVAASGNCACVEPTPDNPFILSVSATDESDSPAYFSSTGPFVDLSAPGTNIMTTAKFGLYTTDSGTSLASPMVAGVAALLFAANPRLTPALAVQMLEATVVDPGGDGYDPRLGYGRVNAAAAVVAAAGYVAPADATPPVVSMVAPLAGSTISGTTVVQVSASDNVAVAKVDLYLDGAYFVSDTTSPYSFALDTRTLANGNHVLEVVAADAAKNSASSGSVTVLVSNNHAPVTNNDTFSAPYRAKSAYTPQVLGVLGNDSDADGNLNTASVKIVSAPNKGGSVKVNADGSVAYTPKQAYRGAETFSYNVKDSLGALSNTATVTVNVQ